MKTKKSSTGHTEQVKNGTDTHHLNPMSRLNVLNKDPAYDYCWKRKAEVESSGISLDGFVPVTDTNKANESYGINHQMNAGGNNTTYIFMYEDVVLCKRPKDVAEYYNAREKSLRQAQYLTLKNVNREVSESFKRNMGNDGYSVTGTVTGDFSQITGHTEG